MKKGKIFKTGTKKNKKNKLNKTEVLNENMNGTINEGARISDQPAGN